jgi:EAL and modified HD-GYP domain-containing signal transduction protein
VLLGLDPIRRWVSLWAMASLAAGAHSELLLNAIVRAKTCELLWDEGRATASRGEGFLLGMCSTLDAIFDAPMDVVVGQLPLGETLRTALLGEDNSARRLLDAVIARERGDWERWQALAEQAGLTFESFAMASREAMVWANDAFSHGGLTGEK